MPDQPEPAAQTEGQAAWEKLDALDPIERARIINQLAQMQTQAEAKAFWPQYEERLFGAPSFGILNKIMDVIQPETQNLYPEQSGVGNQLLLGTAEIPAFLIPYAGPAKLASTLTKVIPRGASIASRLLSVGAREAATGTAYEAMREAMTAEHPTAASVATQAAKGGAYWAGLGMAGSAAWMGLRGAAGLPAVAPELMRGLPTTTLPPEKLGTVSPEVDVVRRPVAGLLEMLPERIRGLVTQDAKGRIFIAGQDRPLTPGESYTLLDALAKEQLSTETKQVANLTGPQVALLTVVNSVDTRVAPQAMTVRYAEILDNIMKGPADSKPQLRALQKLGLTRSTSSLEPMSEGPVRQLMVEAKLAELSERGPLTSEELSILRENLPYTYVKPMVEGARYRETTVPKYLGTEIPEPGQKLSAFLKNIVDPRSEGALRDVQTLVIPREPTVGATPSYTVAQREVIQAKIASASDKIIADKVATDPVYREVVEAALGEKEVEVILARVQQAGGKGEAIPIGGMGRGYWVEHTQITKTAAALLDNLENQIDDPVRTALVRAAMEEGYPLPPGLKARFARFPNAFKEGFSVKPAAEDLFNVVVKRPNESDAFVRLTGTELVAAAKTPGKIVWYEETERASQVLTTAGIERVEKALGLAPDLSPWPLRMGKTVGRTLKRAFEIQPFRHFQFEKAPEIAENMVEMLCSKANYHGQFDREVVALESAYYNLSKAERETFSKLVYAQEKADHRGLGAFSVDGSKGRVDKVGRLYTDLNKHSYEFLAEHRFKELGFDKLPQEVQALKRKEMVSEVEKAKYLVSHVWREGKLTLQVRGVLGNQVLYRMNVRNNKEIEAFIREVETRYGGEVRRDKANRPLVETWTPEDYIKHYEDVPSYDMMLKAVNQVKGLTSADREGLLTIAARKSGRFDLIDRKNVPGFSLAPDDLLSSLFNRIDHTVHRRVIGEIKDKLAVSIDRSPEAVRGYARDFRSGILSSFPDYTHTVRSGLYTAILGGSVRYYLQQATQNLIYTSAHLLATRPGLSIGMAAEAAKLGHSLQFTKLANLPSEFRAAITQLQKDGIIQSSYISEHTARGFGAITKYHTALGGPAYWIGHTTRWVGERMEIGNRQNAALQSLYISFKKDKLSLQEAVQKAKFDIYNIHGMYDSINRPVVLSKLGMLQPVGTLLYMFQSFPAMTLSNLFQVYAKGSVKAKAVQTLALIAAGGALGLPGAALASKAWRLANPESDPEGAIRTGLSVAGQKVLEQMGIGANHAKIAGRFNADLVLYGTPGAAGIDATTMLALSNLPNPEVLDYLGVVASIGKNELRAWELLQRGRYERAAESAMPVSMLQRLMKAARWAREGKATDSNGIPMLNADGSIFKPTAVQTIEAGLGMRQIAETRYQQKQTVRYAFSEAMKRRQEELNRDFSLAVFEQNQPRMVKLIEGARGLNAEMKRRVDVGEDIGADVPLTLNPNVIGKRVEILKQGRIAAMQQALQLRQLQLMQNKQQ